MSYKLYTNCEELPLFIFIKAIEKSDLTGLVIEGQPPTEAVAEAWANIYAEYIDLTKDDEFEYSIQLQKEIALLSHKIENSAGLLQILSNKIYTEAQYLEIIKLLKGYGFHFPKDHDTQDSYNNSVKRISNRLAPFRLQLQMKEGELQRYMDAKEGETLPDNYFAIMLARLQKFGYSDYKVSNKTIMVIDFVFAFKEWLNYVKAHNKQMDK